jgi:dTDP-4-amino-4,6-dideoxygalactose transaminase
MQTKIPFMDLSAMNAEIADELDGAWRGVLESGKFVGGEFVEKFEEHWAAYCGTRYCVGVSDGTSALELAMRALKVVAGDEVVVPANTFIATWEAIIAVGARPVAVDVDPQTLLVTASAIEAARTERTVGVIAVHLFGQPADMDSINRVAKQANLWVIEDAAQAHGATWRGKRAGSLADVGCFSFYPGKNLGAFGDAGAIVTNNAHIADCVKSLANHGRHPDAADRHIRIGKNHRLDGLQAAILSAKLPYLERWNACRRQAAGQYALALTGLALESVKIAREAVSSHHLAVVQINDRDQVQKTLGAEGIATGIHYRTPCHLQPAYKHLTREAMPVSERAAQRIISLPMYPHLTKEQIERVASVLHRALTHHNKKKTPDNFLPAMAQ